MKYYYQDELIYETHTSDLSGLMMAIERSSSIHFAEEVYNFDEFILNHYEQEGIWFEELVVYLKN
ncbi:hypothetical protein [Sutcliffiella rhizosphaerae]|uniref:hypothetical protein n=1 Tax=Sutcliffiella rhizosphaerae TaxID=2880967 RepID=UPI001E33CAB2|nr:hypothetical protein [Sutcliffiella rhizosphaerae]